MQTTFRYKFIDGLLVVAHSDELPTNEEWDEMVKALVAQKRRGMTALIASDSIGPDARQRATLRNATGDIRQAVITRSVTVRGIATALNWLGMSVRAFSPQQMGEAMDYIDVSKKQQPLILATLAELRVGVAGTSVERALRQLDVPSTDLAALFTAPLAKLRSGISSGPPPGAR